MGNTIGPLASYCGPKSPTCSPPSAPKYLRAKDTDGNGTAMWRLRSSAPLAHTSAVPTRRPARAQPSRSAPRLTRLSLLRQADPDHGDQSRVAARTPSGRVGVLALRPRRPPAPHGRDRQPTQRISNGSAFSEHASLSCPDEILTLRIGGMGADLSRSNGRSNRKRRRRLPASDDALGDRICARLTSRSTTRHQARSGDIPERQEGVEVDVGRRCRGGGDGHGTGGGNGGNARSDRAGGVDRDGDALGGGRPVSGCQGPSC